MIPRCCCIVPKDLCWHEFHLCGDEGCESGGQLPVVNVQGQCVTHPFVVGRVYRLRLNQNDNCYVYQGITEEPVTQSAIAVAEYATCDECCRISGCECSVTELDIHVTGECVGPEPEDNCPIDVHLPAFARRIAGVQFNCSYDTGYCHEPGSGEIEGGIEFSSGTCRWVFNGVNFTSSDGATGMDIAWRGSATADCNTGTGPHTWQFRTTGPLPDPTVFCDRLHVGTYVHQFGGCYGGPVYEGILSATVTPVTGIRQINRKQGPGNAAPCMFRRDEAIDAIPCRTCHGNVRLKVFPCELHGRCTIGRQTPDASCCTNCGDFVPRPE